MTRRNGVMPSMPGYHPRSVDRLIDRLLAEHPALLLVGPRATGKTTTAQRLAATVVRLDVPGEAAAFRADPDAALRDLAEPVLLDEWQAVPDVLGAVKRAVDRNARPGRFLLTGSVRADLDAPTWPGTGRLIRVPMFGLTVAERLGNTDAVPLFDRLAQGLDPRIPPNPPNLRDYVEIALHGGFPEAALALSGGARTRWVESYIDQLLTRDAPRVDAPRDPVRLRRYFEACALNSAGGADHKTIYEAAGVNAKTASAYEQLLVNLLVVDRVPPWATNRLKRLIRAPKRYVVDAALLAGALRVEGPAVLRDGDLLGRFLDTFVAAQIRAELPLAECRPRLFHLRDHEGRHEVDRLAEIAGGGVLGIEVKADSGPGADAAKHLAWLRDRLGKRFIAGVVLHTGPRAYAIGDRILAAPIVTLWM